MKAELKGFGRKRVHGADVREMCGKLTMTAQDEDDAKFLARLSRAIFYSDEEITQQLNDWLEKFVP